jgi:hypothetical protein
MQRCPKCNRTYPDDAQKFCTFDGGRLTVDTDAPTSFDLNNAATQTDLSPELGATVIGPAPDLNKTMAASSPQPPPAPPQTSEIPPPAQTGPAYAPRPESWPPAPATVSGPSQTSPLQPSSVPGAQAPAAPPPPHTQSVPSAPLPATPTAAPSPASAPFPSAPAKKSGRTLFIAGGAAVLLLLLAGVFVIAYVAMNKTDNANEAGMGLGNTRMEGNSSTRPGTSNTTTNTNTNTNANSVQAPPNSTRFINSKDKLSGSLAEHFINFSFYYPNNWKLDPKAGASGSSNFATLDRNLRDSGGEYVVESFRAGWYSSNGTFDADRSIFSNRVEYFSSLFAKEYPNYQKVSEGETTVNSQKGYEFRFKSVYADTGTQPVTLYGRMIFLPAEIEGEKSGVALLMLASSAATEFKSPNDVGEKGELPVILKTFRIGPTS